MQKTTFFILSIILSVLLFSCSKDHQEISESDFLSNVLPKEDVNSVDIDNKTMLIFTNEKEPYKIKFDSKIHIDEFLNRVKVKDDNFSMSYRSGGPPTGLFITMQLWQTMILVFPFLFLLHLILLWVALRKIIKSETDNLGKLVYTMISLFFPVFGPILYLTTKIRPQLQ